MCCIKRWTMLQPSNAVCFKKSVCYRLCLIIGALVQQLLLSVGCMGQHIFALPEATANLTWYTVSKVPFCVLLVKLFVR